MKELEAEGRRRLFPALAEEERLLHGLALLRIAFVCNAKKEWVGFPPPQNK